jgi:hypothetical protein
VPITDETLKGVYSYRPNNFNSIIAANAPCDKAHDLLEVKTLLPDPPSFKPATFFPGNSISHQLSVVRVGLWLDALFTSQLP